MLEQLYSPDWLLRRPQYAFLLGLVFSIFGVFSARIIFGANPGLMSVAFTSILLIPTLQRLFGITEDREIREKKFSLPQLVRDHYDIMEIFIYLFLGIFTTYMLLTFYWTNAFSLRMFESQLNVAGLTGMSYEQNAWFTSILTNNIKVLIVCFLLSFFYGAGSILFLAWNASVWGSVFGYVANHSAAVMSPMAAFSNTLVPVVPHMITEAFSYFSATMVGGIASKAIIKERWMSEKFKHVISDSLLFLFLGFVLVLIAAWLEVYIFPRLQQLGTVIVMLIIIGSIIGLHFFVKAEKNRYEKLNKHLKDAGYDSKTIKKYLNK
jgi:uncharacterized membrane protein SpoIIM required for sporulation